LQLGISHSAPALRKAGVNSGLKLGVSRSLSLTEDFPPDSISLKLAEQGST
jgi:hypothetical protein